MFGLYYHEEKTIDIADADLTDLADIIDVDVGVGDIVDDGCLFFEPPSSSPLLSRGAAVASNSAAFFHSTC